MKPQKKKINILYMMTGFAIGGAEKVLLDLIASLDKEKFNMSVVALADMDDTLEDFKGFGIKSEKLDMSRSPKDFFRVLKYLSSFVKKNRIDIIHVHMFHSLPIASLIKVLNPSIKIVFTSHNFNIGSRLRESLVWALKPLRHIDIVFSENMITRMYKANTVVIPNGIDVDRFVGSGEKNEVFTFISIARISYAKNHAQLIECAQILKTKGYEFNIDIVGSTEDKSLIDELKKKIEIRDVQGNVRLLGARKDIPELLKKAHCLVLPSHWEGLPIVILEAGAAGVPIISTPVGAIPSVINEENGYLSTLDDFAKTMEEVLNNISLANKKAQVLSDKIQKSYSIKTVAKQHSKIYSSL